MSICPVLVAIALPKVRHSTCDWVQGVGFYMLLPVMSNLLLAGWLTIFQYVTRSRWKAIALFGVFIAACFGFSFGSFYFTPQVRSYGLLHGYFPGIIYDEDLRIGWRLLWSRSVQVLVLFVFAALVKLLRTSNRRVQLVSLGTQTWLFHIVSLTLTALILLLLGYSLFLTRIVSTASRLASDLGGHIQSAHFDIYYPWGEKPTRISTLKMELEYHYDSLMSELPAHVRPTTLSETDSSSKRIRVFLFRDAAHRKALIGASRTNIAKPWQRTLCILTQSSPHTVIRHELVHVLLAAYGDRLLGVSRSSIFSPPNFGLVEGLAVALDESLRYEISLDARASGILAENTDIEVSDLFRGKFHAYSGYIAYGLAGDFMTYLIARDGIKSVLRIYRHPSTWIHEQLESDINKWRSQLKQTADSSHAMDEHASDHVAERLSSAFSVFDKRCPHYVANQYKMLENSRTGLKDKGTFDRACQLFRLQPYNRQVLDLLLDHFPKDRPLPTRVEALESYVYGKEMKAGARNANRIGPAGRRQLAEALGDWLYKSFREPKQGKTDKHGQLDRIKSLYAFAANGSGFADQRRRRLLKQYAAAGIDTNYLLLDYLARIESRSGRSYAIHRMISTPCLKGLGQYLMGKQLAYAAEFELGFSAMTDAITSFLKPGSGDHCDAMPDELLRELYNEIERDLSRFAFFSSATLSDLEKAYMLIDGARAKIKENTVLAEHKKSIRSEWLARMQWRAERSTSWLGGHPGLE